MAMTPEKKVKNKVMKILKDAGAYNFYASTGGYGKSGVPDIVCCYRGHFLAIECKAGKNTTTALQKINIEAIRKAGGTALVINENNIDEVTDALISIA
jgi:Holliday junction resolvase